MDAAPFGAEQHTHIVLCESWQVPKCNYILESLNTPQSNCTTKLDTLVRRRYAPNMRVLRCCV